MFILFVKYLIIKKKTYKQDYYGMELILCEG